MLLEIRIIVNFGQEGLNHHWEKGMRKDFGLLVMSIKIHMLVLFSTLFIHALKKNREKTFLPLLGGDLCIALLTCEIVNYEERIKHLPFPIRMTVVYSRVHFFFTG